MYLRQQEIKFLTHTSNPSMIALQNYFIVYLTIKYQQQFKQIAGYNIYRIQREHKSQLPHLSLTAPPCIKTKNTVYNIAAN